MRLLFLGDIVGRPGRQAVIEALPDLRRRYALDFVLDGRKARDDGAWRRICEADPVRGEAQACVFTMPRVSAGPTGERPGSLCPFFVRNHWREAKIAAVAVEADDPAWSLREVGGRRMSEATAPVRDSSRADLIGPGEHICF